ncbi:MAG TPA: DUF4384 domain-containing protein, partial [Gemmatimonadales bacterium]|nr:DUF4384 domain-containing protein [Gemmatimonadales bacterium]
MLALSALLVFGAPIAAAPELPPDTALVAQANGLRVFLNSGGDYEPGDRVRVEVSPEADGHLIVFRVDGDGYIRVLFPLDPDLDPFVRGGRRYELRSRGDRESFRADDRGGTGLIYAAIADGPLNVAPFASGTHWDYDRLRLPDPNGDVEAQLTDIVRRMTGNGRFEYDLMGYRVWGPGYESERPVVIAGGGWNPYWDWAWGCVTCGWWSRPGIGVRIGSGWGWSDPWWDPWYGYGYGWGWGGGGWGWGGGGWGYPWRPITVINRPNPPRPGIRNPIYDGRSRPRPVPSGPSRVDPRRDDRPSGGSSNEGRSRPRGGESSRPASSGRPSTSERPSGGAPERNSGRSRPRGNEVTVPVVRPSMERRAEPRPVSRSPEPRYEPRPTQRAPESRPVSSPPPRVERPSSPPPSAPPAS